MKNRLLNALKEAHAALDRISDIADYENGEPVTFLEARQIEDIYIGATANLAEHETLIMEAEKETPNRLDSCKVTIPNIDLILLREQKDTLLAYRDHSNDEGWSFMVDGLLSLIDAIQDSAVKENGFADEDVYSLEQ